MNAFPLLLKREYWEHRNGFLWTPIWITGAFLIITALVIISAEVFRSHANVQVAGFSLDGLRGSISAEDIAKAGNGLDVSQLVIAGMACAGLFFVTFFYLLGALYDDRRDRSVLFWKSLPVSDTATVASKALTALLVIPAFTLVISTLAYLVFLVVICLWAGVHGLNALPAVFAAHPIGMFLRLAAILPIGVLWALPTVGWLMFWSAYARSKPFLWAVLLPILAWIANGWIGLLGGPNIGSNINLAAILGRLLFSVMPGSWISSKFGVAGPKGWLALDGDHVVNAFDPSHIYGVLATADLWLGVVAGVALLAGAIWFRSRRIETSV
jgi:ABC-2 type transport system permease protein